MSCLSRVGCLTVVAVVGGGAWWLYGGNLPTELLRTARYGINREAAAGDSTRARAGDGVAWASIKDARVPTADALASLERPTGPAYITLGAGDLAGVIAGALRRTLPDAAQDLQVAIVDDELRLRGEIPLRELGGRALPEFVSDLLTGRDSVEMAGSLEMVRPGLAQFHVREVIVRGIRLPPRVIPPLLGALRRKAVQADSVSSDAVAIALPRSVSDVRVSRGRVTLYKSVPSK